jgi:hypothetical protein
MLLSLPNELIERTIRLSLPDEITSSNYVERQTILRNLCIVSSHLRDIAQPILEEVVFTSTTKGWGAAFRKINAVGFASRVRRFWPNEDSFDEDEILWSLLAPILPKFTAMQVLALNDVFEVDLKRLEGLSSAHSFHSFLPLWLTRR